MKNFILLFFFSFNLFAEKASECFRVQNKKIPIPRFRSSIDSSTKNNKLLIADPYSVNLIDKENEITNFQINSSSQELYNQAYFSQDENSFILKKAIFNQKDNSWEYEVYDPKTLKRKYSFTTSGTRGEAVIFNKDATIVAVVSYEENILFKDSFKIEVVTLKTGERKTFKNLDLKSNAGEISFSPDSKYLIGPSFKTYINIETGESGGFKFVHMHEPKAFIPNSKNHLIKVRSGSSKFEIDIEAIDPIKLINHFEFPLEEDDFVSTLKLSKDGSKAFISTRAYTKHKTKVFVVDLKKQELVFSKDTTKIDRDYLDFNFNPEENQYTMTYSIDNTISESKIICLDKDQASSTDTISCDQNCSKSKPSLNQITTKLDLCNYSKVSGFNPNKNLKQFLTIINNPDYKKYEAEIIQALSAIFAHSSNLYEDLLLNYPKLTKLDPTAKSNISLCKPNKVDQKERSLELFKYVESLAFNDLSTTAFIMPLQQIILNMDEKEQDRLKEIISQKLSDAAMNDPQFSGVSYAKIFRLTNEAVADLFDDEPEAITDLSLIRPDSKKAELLLFSSKDNPLDNEKLNPYGFYHKKINSFPLDPRGNTLTNKKINSQNYKWKMGNNNFEAKVNVSYKNGGTDIIAPKKLSPSYDNLFKNGLNGLVVLGSNLKGSSPKLMENYLTYYKKEGFTCESQKNLKKIDDLKKFIKTKIASGRIDYFIKEAHSDGDEKNVFFIDRTAFLLKCVHKEKNESVELIFPNDNEEKTVAFKNLEFKDVMDERTKNGGHELIYFNTSCWSAKSKAVVEIEAVSNKLLVEIPATTSVDTFTNGKNEAEKLLFTSFRNRASYEQMRTELLKNPEYKGKLANRFIFPDEEEYDEYIRNKLSIPLDIDIKIYDNKKREYTLDQD